MKHQILEQLLALTKQQQQALAQDDMDTFEALLTKRQVHIDTLEQLHLEHPETKEQKETALLQELVSLEEANKKVFNEKFEEVKQKLNQIREQKKVNSLYTNVYARSQEQGIFFDQK